MEQATVLPQHDIFKVTVANTEYVREDDVARQRLDEALLRRLDICTVVVDEIPAAHNIDANRQTFENLSDWNSH